MNSTPVMVSLSVIVSTVKPGDNNFSITSLLAFCFCNTVKVYTVPGDKGTYYNGLIGFI